MGAPKRHNDKIMEDKSGNISLLGADVTVFSMRVPTALLEAFRFEFADEAGQYGKHLEKAMAEYLKSRAGYRFYYIKGEA